MLNRELYLNLVSKCPIKRIDSLEECQKASEFIDNLLVRNDFEQQTDETKTISVYIDALSFFVEEFENSIAFI